MSIVVKQLWTRVWWDDVCKVSKSLGSRVIMIYSSIGNTDENCDDVGGRNSEYLNTLCLPFFIRIRGFELMVMVMLRKKRKRILLFLTGLHFAFKSYGLARWTTVTLCFWIRCFVSSCSSFSSASCRFRKRVPRPDGFSLIVYPNWEWYTQYDCNTSEQLNII